MYGSTNLLVRLLLLWPVLINASLLDARDFYVSPKGKDTWSGELAEPNASLTDGPVLTLKRAARITGPGDTCFIRKGVYRETLKPVKDGTAKRPVTFTNYRDEKPVISGADLVTGWKKHTSAIWTAHVHMTLKDRNQVFANGSMLTEARWPDNTGTLLKPVRAHALSGSVNTIKGKNIPESAGSWKGALLWCAGGSEWICWTAHIESYNPETSTFTFDKKKTRRFYTPRKGNPYCLMGVRAALDYEGEWWYAEEENKLYLIPPEGEMPSKMRIEVKRRLDAVDLSNRSHIHISGLNFRSAGIRTNTNSSHILLEKLSGRYVAHSYERDVSGKSGVLVHGDQIRVRNSTFAYSSGSVVDMRGTDNRLFNCFIHHGNYGAKWRGTLAISGRRHIAAYNTIRHSGRDLVNVHGLTESLIYKNDLSDAGWLTSDLGIFYGHNTDFGNTVISHNLVHDNHAPDCNMGIYFDHCSHNVIVHHNIVWNIKRDPIRFNNPSYHNLAYHNTCWNTGRITTFDHAHRNDLFATRYRNNILNAPIKLPEHVCVDHNLIDKSPAFADPASRDFTLKPNSKARDAAVPVKGMAENVKDNKPDIGALEYGREFWRTGHDFSSPPKEPLTLKMPVTGGMNMLKNACFELRRLEYWKKTGASRAKLVRGNGWGAKNFSGHKKTYATGTSKRELRLGGRVDGVEQTVHGLDPETRYTLSGWLRVSSSQVSASLGVKDAASGTKESVTTNKTGWVRKILNFTTGPDSTQVTVFIKKTSPGEGYLWADNLAVFVFHERI